ncbi:MAG: hypothetical protein E7329_11025 [Clostridiales bacterium]|nr:hypothetical protein [Clostridiales bacterium]
MKDIFTQAIALIEKNSSYPLVVALEGGAATGKTTLAAQLSAHFQAPVISMDEFFLPPALRTKERFLEPGGNIHYERFDAQVAAPIRAGKAFSYQVFDCGKMDFGGERHIPLVPLLIVEGVYSLHPRYQDIYDLRLFLKTNSAAQDQRLRARGEWLYQRFQEDWLPMEQAYYDAFHPEKNCHAILTT